MGVKWHRGKKNLGPKAVARRQGALERLKDQVKEFGAMYHMDMFSGEKLDPPIPVYSPERQSRIRAEIEVLKTRV